MKNLREPEENRIALMNKDPNGQEIPISTRQNNDIKDIWDALLYGLYTFVLSIIFSLINNSKKFEQNIT